ncbi:MAG TPA: hypothetical protein PLF48_07885 [Chitinophagales bacterium]|nr:hypothetical protein [Chitinophagales bacterium]
MIKNFFSSIIIAILLIHTQNCIGQNLLSEVPKTKDEFIASEKNVVATIDWLETTPFNQEENKRLKQKALLMVWITDSPTVTLEINAAILTFTKKNPDLLLTYMGGWTKYSLLNNYSTDQIQGNLAGLKSVIRVYKNLSLKKDKEVEKLIELDNKGELENWVNEKLIKK